MTLGLATLSGVGEETWPFNVCSKVGNAFGPWLGCESIVGTAKVRKAAGISSRVSRQGCGATLTAVSSPDTPARVGSGIALKEALYSGELAESVAGPCVEGCGREIAANSNWLAVCKVVTDKSGSCGKAGSVETGKAGTLATALAEIVALDSAAGEIGVELLAICCEASAEGSPGTELAKNGCRITGSGCTGIAGCSASCDPLATVKSRDEHSLVARGEVDVLAGFGKLAGFPEAIVSAVPAAKRLTKLSFPKVAVVPEDKGIASDFGCGISS